MKNKKMIEASKMAFILTVILLLSTNLACANDDVDFSSAPPSANTLSVQQRTLTGSCALTADIGPMSIYNKYAAVKGEAFGQLMNRCGHADPNNTSGFFFLQFDKPDTTGTASVRDIPVRGKNGKFYKYSITISRSKRK